MAFRPHLKFTHKGEGNDLVSDYDIAIITVLGFFEESSTVKIAGYGAFTPKSLHEAFLKVVESKNKCVTLGYGTFSKKYIKRMMALNLFVLPQEGCNVITEVKESVICCKPESYAVQFGHSGSPLICEGTVFGLFKDYYNYTLDGKEIVAYTYTAVWPFIKYFETQLGRKITAGAMNILPVFICQLLAIAFAVVRNCTNLTFPINRVI
ncbi:uncharacterized protein LOC112127461 [Cimex lectularius]|uniref:Peptidase S1 domain-containing protein n=1 Tax=Cimex lectularius TaxID=79782 RepID=A0A8I6SP72_CIMLE|nr:uncharacterized protein LOC112127461 [Cimex lectularius]